MNKNLQSPTKLTEFAPLQSEGSKPQSVGQFISSIFKKVKTVIPEEILDDNVETTQDSLPTWAVDSSTAQGFKESDTLPVYNVDVTEGRSLPNVLKRISNLLALKSNNLQDYGDTELKQYWMPDSVSKECYECSEKFTTFRRRHHCRVCGQIFCSQCCNQQIPGKIFGCTGDLRVCTYCCKVVLSYLQSSDINNELSTDLKVLQENLQTKFGTVSQKILDDDVGQTISSSMDVGSLKRKISVGYQEEKFNSRSSDDSFLTSEEKIKALQNSSSLRSLYEEIYKPTTGVQFAAHRHRLQMCNDCILGSDLVDWLIFQQKAKNRVQASALCQALLAGGYIDSIVESSAFIDGYSFYRKGVILSPEAPKNMENFDLPSQEEPIWVQQIPQESSTTEYWIGKRYI